MIDNRMGAIFDLDGTLLDSMGVWRKIDEDFLGKRGFVVPDDYLDDGYSATVWIPAEAEPQPASLEE